MDLKGILSRRTFWTWMTWIILVMSVTFTLWEWYSVQVEHHTKIHTKFLSRTQRIKTAVDDYLTAYEQILRSSASLFAVIPDVTPKDWREYVKNLQMDTFYPGTHFLGFSQRVMPLVEGLSTPISITTVPQEKVTVTLIEPSNASNSLLLGKDWFSEPHYRLALERARDTGTATLAHQPTNTPTNFMMFLPVYHSSDTPETVAERRATLFGFVFSGLCIDSLLKKALKRQNFNIGLEIYEGSQVDSETLMYRNYTLSSHFKPQFVNTFTDEIGGLTWTWHSVTLPEFDIENQNNTAQFVLISGLCVVLLLVIMRSLTVISQQTRELVKSNSLLQQEIGKREQAAKTVHEQEYFLRLVLDNIPHAIFWKDRCCKYLGCNQYVIKLVGLNTIEEIIGKTDFDFFGRDQAQYFIDSDRQVMETNAPIYHFIQPARLNGKHYWFETNKIPLHNGQGDVIGVLCTSEDVTERKQAEELLKKYNLTLEYEVANRTEELAEKNALLQQEIAERQLTAVQLQEKLKLVARFKVLANTTSDFVGYTDLEGKVLYVNPAGLAMVGRTDEEVATTTFVDYVPAEIGQKILEEYMPIVMEKGIWSGEVDLQHVDGRKIPVSQVIVLLADENDKPIGIGTIIRDMTEHKRIEKELHNAKEIAEAANRAKSIFLANMSHELRTPLNGILGYTQILARDFSLTPKQREGVDIIQRSGEYLLTLINDVLDLSKIEAGRVELEPKDFHLSEFLDGIVELFQMRAKQKALSFVYEQVSEHAHSLPTWVHADEKRLRQILINLLANAIKFTEQGSVTFKVGYECDFHSHELQLPSVNPSCRKLRFQVEDSGVGIATAEIEKIFLPFYQADSKNRSEGTGLGLPITKKLVEMMGGEIHVNSTLDHGSQFWIVVDLQGIAVTENLSPAKKSLITGYQRLKENVPLKILVIDNRWENRTIIVNLLSSLGFDVLEATNGMEGIEKACTLRPDLILLELIIPVFDGFEIVRQLRSKPDFEQLPIIAVSASVFDYHRHKSLEAGCNDFLAKPIHVESLLELLRKYLKLEWIFAETPSIEAESPMTSDDDVLTVEQATTLYDLAMQGDIQGIVEEIDKLEHVLGHPTLTLVNIRQLAKEFQEEQICELLQKYLDYA